MMRSSNERELMLLCRKLAFMLKAGIPLVKGIDILAKSSSSNTGNSLQEVLKRISVRLKNGSSFSNALRGVEGFFPDYMIHSIEAGERGGILQEVLEKQAEGLSKAYQAQEKLKTALLYPVFLLGTAVVVIGIMLLVVLPVFAELFQSMNVNLPLPTRVLLSIGQIVKEEFILLVIVVAGTLFAIWRFLQKPGNKLMLHQKLLGIPLLGSILKNLDMQHWLEVLSLLLIGGVALVDGVIIANKVIANQYMRHRLIPISRQLQKGTSFSLALKHSRCVNTVIIDLVKAGEYSGQLPEMLAEGAGMCQRSADNQLQRLQVLAEPIIILFIGLLTGSIVLSIMLPVMDLMTLYT